MASYYPRGFNVLLAARVVDLIPPFRLRRAPSPHRPGPSTRIHSSCRAQKLRSERISQPKPALPRRQALSLLVYEDRRPYHLLPDLIQSMPKLGLQTVTASRLGA